MSPPHSGGPPTGRHVLIVGAGPAGASLALRLARGGIPVTLVEARHDFARRFRGEGLMPSGLEALADLGLWPLPATIPHRHLSAWSFFLEGRLLFEVDEPMGSRRPCTLIDQEALLGTLVAAAELEPEFRFLAGRAVAALLTEGGRISGVELEDGERIAADLVVGCDGRSSPLRRKAGLALEPGESPLDVLWFLLPAPDCEPIGLWLADRFVTVLGDGGSFALFQTAAGNVQLGWALANGELADPGDDSWKERWARGAPPELGRLLLALPAVEDPVRLPVRVGLASRWHRPGLLLLGDAVHPMSPLRAQGLNMALRDARTAAECLLPLLGSSPARVVPPPAELDAALGAIATERLSEVRTLQALQLREARRAERLLRQRWLRRLLAAGAGVASPLLARRWASEQRALRDGLPSGPWGWA